ncbi:cytochrome c [uncultured Roseibium sp.]|uniref:c-type cytochrome n=1 Tax=uncultured Roseibium sp. TaxID=1936171 RepID=UPI002609DD54|nr:cytochrome c [uncultured Roseibium sp.]
MNRKLIGALLSVSVCFLSLVTAWAHSGAMGVVKERMDAMTEISRNVKTVGRMLKEEIPYDGEAIANAGEVIADHAGEAMTRLFPKGSLQSPTEASPAIWTDWKDFSQLAERLKASALKLGDGARTDADRNSIMSDFAEMAGTCKSCHEVFRVKK